MWHHIGFLSAYVFDLLRPIFGLFILRVLDCVNDGVGIRCQWKCKLCTNFAIFNGRLDACGFRC